MKITSFFVRNHQFTLVLLLMIVVVSLNTMFSMPRAEDPEINPPQYPILVVYPGTSPKDIEELVVKPIEERIYALENIKEVNTRIEDGIAVLVVEYKYGSNVEAKYQELVREINALQSELPEDIYSLKVSKVTPTDVSILQMALVSENASTEKLQHHAKKLKEELEKITALKKVQYWGIADKEVTIDLQLDKIAQLQIPINYVIGSIQSEAVNIPAGSVRAGNKIFNVKTSGKYNSIDEIANTVVFAGGGKITLLKDVAQIGFGAGEAEHITRLNGHRAVLVTAAQKPGENIAKTQEAYLPILENFQKQLPANIELIKNFDQADNVKTRLNQLSTDFLIAIGLVLITLLPLGWRASLVVMIAIPLSLGLGIVSINAMGYSLNQLSIVGFVVALGLLVDDSIVVVENIERWLREGHTKRFAAVEATKQISLAVLGCTATLIIAFLPLVFMPEASGEFIRSMPMAVITSVFASMLVSLTIVPFMASRFLSSHHSPEGNIFMRGLKRIIHGSYAQLLVKALQRPKTTLIIALTLFAASLLVFKIIGFRLFPPSEKPQFLINITTPIQTNLEATDRISKQVEEVLAKEKRIAYYTTNVGKGNPRIYYNEIPENRRPDYAQIFVQLQNHIKASEKKEIIEQLRKIFTNYAGVKIEVKDFEQGPPIEAPLAIRLKGENLDTLSIWAKKMESILKSIPGTIYINNEVSVMKSDIRLRINTQKARTLGVLTSEIDKTVRMAIAGIEVGVFSNENGEDYKIILRSPRKDFATLDQLKNIYVNNIQGTAIPLNQIASIEFETSPTAIKHLNKKRMVVIKGYTAQGYMASSINKAFEKQLANLHLPKGYTVEIAGEAEGKKKAFGEGFQNVIIATVFLFIMVLILEFKTLKSTLIVLSVIPLGIIGGVLMLWITGNPLSFVAIIGFIALAGVEVKNSILLVDFTNQLRAEGKPLDEAIKEAGELRFLPIVLTSLTAIGGLIPIALNNNPLISPLAIVLIGGLISSTLLSRIVTPVVYKLIPPKINSVD